MQPHEIKPDTALCTILGYNAQTGASRKYLTKILKDNGLNATAIALNVKEEHFDFTMSNVGQSKVDKMIIEQEFGSRAVSYCDTLDEAAKRHNRVDFIEVEAGKIKGYCFDDAVLVLFEEPQFVDEQIRFVAKMILIANRWYGATVEVDAIPMLIKN